jgi:hypothetical protein
MVDAVDLNAGTEQTTRKMAFNSRRLLVLRRCSKPYRVSILSTMVYLGLSNLADKS